MGIFVSLRDSKTMRAARTAAPLLGLAILVDLFLPNEQARTLAAESYSIRAENRLPELTTSTQAQQNSEPNSKQTLEARKRQIASDSAKLLQMAIDLKAEMDKSSKETLSLDIVRKADAITKFAHDLKEEMKQSAGDD